MSYRNLSTLETVEAFCVEQEAVEGTGAPDWFHDLMNTKKLEFKYGMFFYQPEDSFDAALTWGDYIILKNDGSITHLNAIEFNEKYQEL